MSTSENALPKKRRRPLRKLIFLAVLAGGVVAIKNAVKDKGGSYESPAQPFDASVPVPPAPPVGMVTAEDFSEHRPVENLDEFADPVKPSAVAKAADPDELKETPGKIDPFGIR